MLAVLSTTIPLDVSFFSVIMSASVLTFISEFLSAVDIEIMASSEKNFSFIRKAEITINYNRSKADFSKLIEIPGSILLMF